MNFLAHFALSNHNPEIKLGNFLGDFVRGSNLEKYPNLVQKGIVLHRNIDNFTDTHQSNKELKKLFYEKYGKFSGIVVDVLFDYYLANNWDRFYEKYKLPDFTQNTYSELTPMQKLMPNHPQRFFENMKKGDWLSGYGTKEGIQKSFESLHRRSKFENKLNLAHQEIDENGKLIEEIFLDFFPSIIDFSLDFTENNNSGESRVWKK